MSRPIGRSNGLEKQVGAGKSDKKLILFMPAVRFCNVSYRGLIQVIMLEDSLAEMLRQGEDLDFPCPCAKSPQK
jgi:hypothetical protein